ncbi:MAG: MFS transporter [Acidimicrobiia bacterium]
MLYDLANTIFVFGVITLYFPTWLVVERGFPDSALALATALAGMVVILVSPWVGARTDHHGRRLPTLVGTTSVTIVATALLATLPPAQSLWLLGVALVGFHVGSVVYDALLPDVSTPANRGLVSGVGVGVGYVGSFLALGIGTLALTGLDLGYPAVFRAIAAGFLVFALPSFLLVRERPRLPLTGAAPGLARVAASLAGSWRRALGYPGVTRFLVSRFLYTDAINTLILFVAVYAQAELGFDLEGSTLLVGTAILVAVAGGVAAGRLVDRVGPGLMLRVVLVLWMATILATVGAALTGATWAAWLIGPASGLALGGTWTADRVLMARISPPRHLGEFYGLYATVGRFASVLGPLVWGAIVDLLGWGRNAAMIALAAFIGLALLVLRPVDDRSPTWGPDELEMLS